jgi:hypothetical protein
MAQRHQTLLVDDSAAIVCRIGHLHVPALVPTQEARVGMRLHPRKTVESPGRHLCRPGHVQGNDGSRVVKRSPHFWVVKRTPQR